MSIGFHVTPKIEGSMSRFIIMKKVIDDYIDLGIYCIQIFQFSASDENELAQIKKYVIRKNFKIFIHSPYSINIARHWDSATKHILDFVELIEFANKIGAEGVVVHFGKKMDLLLSIAVNNSYSSLLHVHQRTIKYKNVKILLETATGQGTEMCHVLEDMAYFYKKFSSNNNLTIVNRFKLCIDTCHIFGAGYDLRTESDIKIYLKSFDEKIGLKNISLIHLNDSKEELGSKKDRHLSIGEGHIGIDGLTYFAKYFSDKKVPIIIETPSANIKHELHIFKKLLKRYIY